MLTWDQIRNTLFLDIETAAIERSYEDLSERMQALWDKKSLKYQRQEPEKSPEELFYEKAGIHAEFGQVVCISCGIILKEAAGATLRLKSFYGQPEKSLLEDFGDMLEKFTKNGNKLLCAHNGKEFDFPYLGRRFLIQGVPLPDVLQVQGKKPWETVFVDTMEMWKFGDFKSYTSLDLLAAIFDVPTPKDDMDGSQVNEVFWYQNDVERIKTYCEKDVSTTVQVCLKMSGLAVSLEEEHT